MIIDMLNAFVTYYYVYHDCSICVVTCAIYKTVNDRVLGFEWLRDMASSATLEIFNPEVESTDDYKERFDFHCTAREIPQRRKKLYF